MLWEASPRHGGFRETPRKPPGAVQPVISPVRSLNNNPRTASKSFTPGCLQVSSMALCEVELFVCGSPLGLKGFAMRYCQIC